MVIRMTLPSLEGLAPTSESLRARSMSRRAVLSNGVMRMVRASGMAKEASCCSGVGEP